MELKSKSKFKRIENAINQLPEFRNQVKYSRGMICTQVLMITQENNVFSIHIRLGANPLLTAKLVQHLSKEFDVEIGDPLFISEDHEIYWGEEAMKAYEDYSQHPPTSPGNTGLLDLESFHSITEN